VKVSLFLTCLVDQCYPEAGLAAVRVLERLGCEVSVPPEQTCCGQPAFNSGYWAEARRIARCTLDAFEDAENVVCLAGSCSGMGLHYFPELFKDQPADARRVAVLLPKLTEFSQFLVNKLKVTDLGASFPQKVVYHPSCHARRLMGVEDEPLRLLNRVSGLQLMPLNRSSDCCGFGGTFAVKTAGVSAAMTEEKAQNIMASGADYVTSTDLGCLLNISGRLKQAGSLIQTLHLAQILDQTVAGGRA
jgi:L-lactate dehydrogenase complex protein LldE